MARLARSTIIGCPHQVTQRGNYEQAVFDEEIDFRRYLVLLQDCISRFAIEIWAYCLMQNHAHFVCVPRVDGALAHGFNTLHMMYAQYFHRKKGRAGHLWRGRFLSCIMDDRSVIEEVRFIENNPVRAGLAKHTEGYPWSSARYHVLGETNAIIQDVALLKERIIYWKAYLENDMDERIISRIRQNLRTGRPCGEDGFLSSLEETTGRRLRALPRGRPRKEQAELQE